MYIYTNCTVYFAASKKIAVPIIQLHKHAKMEHVHFNKGCRQFHKFTRHRQTEKKLKQGRVFRQDSYWDGQKAWALLRIQTAGPAHAWLHPFVHAWLHYHGHCYWIESTCFQSACMWSDCGQISVLVSLFIYAVQHCLNHQMWYTEDAEPKARHSYLKQTNFWKSCGDRLWPTKMERPTWPHVMAIIFMHDPNF